MEFQTGSLAVGTDLFRRCVLSDVLVNQKMSESGRLAFLNPGSGLALPLGIPVLARFCD